MLELRLNDDARLRLLEERDAAELYRLIDENRDYLARWLPWAAGETLPGVHTFIKSTRRQLADNNGIQTAVIVDRRIGGVIGVHGIDWPNRSTSLGYWLAEQFQGRGVMTAAVHAYTRHAFGAWELNRVELQAAVDNARSRAIAERLGFTCEGLLRQAERVGDRVHDVAVYSLLASEWRG